MSSTPFTIQWNNWQDAGKVNELIQAVSERAQLIGRSHAKDKLVTEGDCIQNLDPFKIITPPYDEWDWYGWRSMQDEIEAMAPSYVRLPTSTYVVVDNEAGTYTVEYYTVATLLSDAGYPNGWPRKYRDGGGVIVDTFGRMDNGDFFTEDIFASLRATLSLLKARVSTFQISPGDRLIYQDPVAQKWGNGSGFVDGRAAAIAAHAFESSSAKSATFGEIFVYNEARRNYDTVNRYAEDVWSEPPMVALPTFAIEGAPVILGVSVDMYAQMYFWEHKSQIVTGFMDVAIDVGDGSFFATYVPGTTTIATKRVMDKIWSGSGSTAATEYLSGFAGSHQVYQCNGGTPGNYTQSPITTCNFTIQGAGPSNPTEDILDFLVVFTFCVYEWEFTNSD